jgi:hypothetical protein
MRIVTLLAAICALTVCPSLLIGMSQPLRKSQPTRPGGQNTASAGDKLVYADFENVHEGRAASNRGGQIQLYPYQQNPANPPSFKGLANATPAAPESVRLKAGDPNHAVAFAYELRAPNDWAGVTMEVQGQPDQDGKPVPDDVSGFRTLSAQVYATGVDYMRVELISKGLGISTQAYPQLSFKIMPGFNTYEFQLKKLAQPSYVQDRVDNKDVLQKLTAVTLSAYCGPCRPITGQVVIDNLVFEK